MAVWQDEMIPILRVMISDTSEDSPTNSDESLEQILLVAAKQVDAELQFDNDYRISIANGTLSPDPTVTSTKDDSFVNLVTIKAACIMDRGSAIIAARQAIAIKDGSSAIDLKGTAAAKLKLLEKGGWCAVYEDAKFEYQTDNSTTSAGVAIMTPFRLLANQTTGSFSNHFRSRQTIF